MFKLKDGLNRLIGELFLGHKVIVCEIEMANEPAYIDESYMKRIQENIKRIRKGIDAKYLEKPRPTMKIVTDQKYKTLNKYMV